MRKLLLLVLCLTAWSGFGQPVRYSGWTTNSNPVVALSALGGVRNTNGTATNLTVVGVMYGDVLVLTNGAIIKNLIVTGLASSNQLFYADAGGFLQPIYGGTNGFFLTYSNDVPTWTGTLNFDQINLSEPIPMNIGGSGSAFNTPATNVIMVYDVAKGSNVLAFIGSGIGYDSGTTTLTASGGGDTIWTNDSGVVQMLSSTNRLKQFWDVPPAGGNAFEITIDNGANANLYPFGLLMTVQGTNSDFASGIVVRNKSTPQTGSSVEQGDVNVAQWGLAQWTRGGTGFGVRGTGIGVMGEGIGSYLHNYGVLGMTESISTSTNQNGAGVIGLNFNLGSRHSSARNAALVGASFLVDGTVTVEDAVLLLDNVDTGIPLILGRTNNGVHVFRVEHNGMVSNAVGYAFPDGSIQTTAATGGSGITNGQNNVALGTNSFFTNRLTVHASSGSPELVLKEPGAAPLTGWASLSVLGGNLIFNHVDAAGNETPFYIHDLVAVTDYFSNAVQVPDDPYDATLWNGNLTVPTKNAIRDKIESMPSGTVTSVSGDTNFSIATPTTTPVITFTNFTGSGPFVRSNTPTLFNANLTGTSTFAVAGIGQIFLTNTDGSFWTNLNATELRSGTIADARLSTNVALLNGTNTFTGTNKFIAGTRTFIHDSTQTTITNSGTLTATEFANGQRKDYYNGAVTTTVDKTNGNMTLAGQLSANTIVMSNPPSTTAVSMVGLDSGGKLVTNAVPSGGSVSPTTLTQTNFVLNTIYTNGSQAAILKASVALTTANVTGQAAMSLMADQAGGSTYVAISTNAVTTTLGLSFADTYVQTMAGIVAGGATYYWTNTSAGSGDSAAIVDGTGQIATIASGTNGATGATGATGASATNSVPLFGHSAAVGMTANVSRYGIISGEIGGNGTENLVQIPLAVAGTLSTFYIFTTAANIGGTTNITFAVRTNGVDTPITCVLSTGTTTNDLTHSVSVAAGTLVNIRWLSTSNLAAFTYAWGLKFQ